MKRLIGPRCCGKTTWAIEEALKKDATLVCRDEISKKHIIEICNERGLPYPKIKNYSVFSSSRKPIGEKYIIDDMDRFLTYMYNGGIIAYTETNGD